MRNTGLGILNVGAGDTKLSFDPARPADVEHATKVVTDMIRQGYAIMVHVGDKDGKPLYQRAEAFDAKTHEYIIMGTPEALATANGLAAPLSRLRKQGKTSRVPAHRTHGVSIARSAGG